MKIWHISDTHAYHWLLDIPKDVDVVVHSGDCSNYRDPHHNEVEVRNFIEWYKALPIKHKIYVAGNHDTSIERRLVKNSEFEQNGITYLENSSIVIEGIKFYGSPITPVFGDWAFMRRREKIHEFWDVIDEDTNVLITHGPPKSILDSASRGSLCEMAGCSNLLKKALELRELRLHCFGHIHNNGIIRNAGTRTVSEVNTLFSNGSVVVDGGFGYLTSNGNLFEIVGEKCNKI